MKPQDKKKHQHEFTRSKTGATVETCACGKFRHTENAGAAISEKRAPIPVYLESNMTLNRKTWNWVRADDNKVELLGYESAQDALDGLTQANLIAQDRYVSVDRPAPARNVPVMLSRPELDLIQRLLNREVLRQRQAEAREKDHGGKLHHAQERGTAQDLWSKLYDASMTTGIR